MTNQIHRLGLGTAQFGSHYGVSNRHGQPPRQECEAIVKSAYAAGIRYYDTAAYYGDADLILAESLPGPAKVTSKVNDRQGQYKRCCNLFGDNLHAVYGVNAVSIYWEPTPWVEIAKVVQLPLNLADSRNLKLVCELKANRREVHARSVFLQGLLLQRGATIRQCLKFVLDTPVDIALVGVNSVQELEAIIEAVETLDQESDDFTPWLEPHELDPRTWGQECRP